MINVELNIGPIRPQRNLLTGRFLKGHVPANKGKRWDEYMSKRAQQRSKKGWKNLDKFRHRPESAGRPPKAVIAVAGDGRWKYFSFIGTAAAWLGGNRSNVARCCRENSRHLTNTDHRYKGIRFYFESDDIWISKIRTE